MALPSALPGDWDTYSPYEKIGMMNTWGVTSDDLLGLGFDQGSIDWMTANGFQGGTTYQAPAPTAATYTPYNSTTT